MSAFKRASGVMAILAINFRSLVVINRDLLRLAVIGSVTLALRLRIPKKVPYSLVYLDYVLATLQCSLFAVSYRAFKYARTNIKKLSNMLEQVLAEDLAEVFNQCFEKSERTILCIGASEPFYVPQNTTTEFSCGKSVQAHSLNRIFSREDYSASVLHEAAHWCVAGCRRRELLDYGYWYEPDGRDSSKQAEFERVEVRPQALERVMSVAVGMPFRLSADNASDPSCRPSEDFIEAVQQQTLSYVESGLPPRALQFVQALDKRFTGTRSYAKLCSYVASDLL